MKIPNKISDETVREVEKEVRAMFSGFNRRRVRFHEIFASELPPDYKPIGESKNVLVIPLNSAEEGAPLCLKLSYQNRHDDSPNRIIQYVPTQAFTSVDPISSQEIDNNRRALSKLDLEIVVPPQRVVDPFKRYAYKGLLVPDLTCRGTMNVRDLTWNFGYKDPLYKVYKAVVKKLDLLKIKFVGHTNPFKPRKYNLEWCVKSMLFLVEGKGERFLVAGDLNHFEILYGKCSSCGESGPIMRE